MLSVIIPAYNEANEITRCLEALSHQNPGFEIIVVANGCTDDTAAAARKWQDDFALSGTRLAVIETPTPGKPGALNLGDAAAGGDIRIYLDADVQVTARLLDQIADALRCDSPRYASGTLHIAPPRSHTTKLFARAWTQLPFFTEAAPGAGLYAVNKAGRARWDVFPDLISDDGFVRGLFAPHERVQVDAAYLWPLAEGFGPLLRTRRRQEVGTRELADFKPQIYPGPTQGHSARILAKVARRDPMAMGLYVVLTGWAKLTANRIDRRWHRHR